MGAPTGLSPGVSRLIPARDHARFLFSSFVRCWCVGAIVRFLKTKPFIKHCSLRFPFSLVSVQLFTFERENVPPEYPDIAVQAIESPYDPRLRGRDYPGRRRPRVRQGAAQQRARCRGRRHAPLCHRARAGSGHEGAQPMLGRVGSTCTCRRKIGASFGT